MCWKVRHGVRWKWIEEGTYSFLNILAVIFGGYLDMGLWEGRVLEVVMVFYGG